MTIFRLLMLSLFCYSFSGCSIIQPSTNEHEVIAIYRQIYTKENDPELIVDLKKQTYQDTQTHGYTNIHEVFRSHILFDHQDNGLAIRAGQALYRATWRMPSIEEREKKCKDILIQALEKIGAIDSINAFFTNGVGRGFDENEWVTLALSKDVKLSALFQWHYEHQIHKINPQIP